MSEKTGGEKLLYCSFCGKSQHEVRKLIAGPSVFICDECIELCNDIIAEETKLEEAMGPDIKKLPKPQEIREVLDEYVIGQEQAKKVLAVAVYNHYKRIEAATKPGDVEMQKSNILLLGPTGSGKTLLAQTLARILKVPFAMADATNLTEAGYVGEDVENIILNLLQSADYDVEKAQRGIVYIDEIDKIASRDGLAGGGHGGPDVSREGVQRDILPIVEGTTVNTKHGMVKTDHILFIAAGAFHVSKPSDLIPELQGRFPIRVELEPLTREDFVRILTEPRNALVKQYTALLGTEELTLSFTPGAVQRIADFAARVNDATENIGARRLHTVMERLLDEVSFDAPDRAGAKVRVDEAFVRSRLEPLVRDEDLSRYIL